MRKTFRRSLPLFLTMLLGGCVNFGGLSDSLTQSMLSQDDPGIVRDGAPAYLILIDTLIADNPGDTDLLMAGAKLYGAYAGAFTETPERAQRLAARAHDYGRRGLCGELPEFCNSLDAPFPEFEQAVSELRRRDVGLVYSFATAWAGYVQANSGDWKAVADLPRIQRLLDWVIATEPAIDRGNAHVYLGVLATLRPASLGGEPEKGRAHFEQAVALSGGDNLMAKVLFAKHYARLVFDQDLHDRLLNEVLAAPARAGNLTLINAIAKEQAADLLASGEDYF